MTFAVRVECTTCGHLMLFNAQKYRTGNKKIMMLTEEEGSQLGELRSLRSKSPGWAPIGDGPLNVRVRRGGQAGAFPDRTRGHPRTVRAVMSLRRRVECRRRRGSRSVQTAQARLTAGEPEERAEALGVEVADHPRDSSSIWARRQVITDPVPLRMIRGSRCPRHRRSRLRVLVLPPRQPDRDASQETIRTARHAMTR